MKIGITGATGHLGQFTVAHLKEKTDVDSIIALVRTPSKAAHLGVEARPFDYTKKEELVAPLKDIDVLLLISSNEIGQRETQHKNVINAAKEAGVKRIVYTSLLHADTSSLSLAPEHLVTEEAIKASGMSYTILRNGWYTENYTASIPGALKAGVLVGSAGNGKISSAAREDYAEAAAVVLSADGPLQQVYELAGDDAYTLSDLAAEISRQTEKNIPYHNLSEAEYTKVLVQAGFPKPLAAAFAGWDIATSKGDLYDNGKVLSKLLGHPTTPLAEVVKKALA